MSQNSSAQQVHASTLSIQAGQKFLVSKSPEQGDFVGFISLGGQGCSNCFQLWDLQAHPAALLARNKNKAFKITPEGGKVKLLVDDPNELINWFAGKDKIEFGLSVELSAHEKVTIYSWEMNAIGHTLFVPEIIKTGTSLHQITVTKNKQFTNTPSLKIVSGNDDNAFKLDQQNNIVVNKPLKMNARSKYDLTVEAQYTDHSQGIDSKTRQIFTIYLWRVLVKSPLVIPENVRSNDIVGDIILEGENVEFVNCQLSKGDKSIFDVTKSNKIAEIHVQQPQLLKYENSPYSLTFDVTVKNSAQGIAPIKTEVDIIVPLSRKAYIESAKKIKVATPSELRKQTLGFELPLPTEVSQQEIVKILRAGLKP
jgi:hypothetical protein